jgi:predicted DNA-binding transcriptional regulator AlpA
MTERPLFEHLEDCQAAIGLLMRKDALDALRHWEPEQGKRLIEAFQRLGGVGGKKKEKHIERVMAHGEDRHVDIHEAARIIGYSERWLYNHHRQLPFTRPTRTGRLRFSAKAIQQWLLDSPRETA